MRLIWGLTLLLCPTQLVRTVANTFNYGIAPEARIGFSFLVCDKLAMAKGARVEHLNLVRLRRTALHPKARLGHMNICREPVMLRLSEHADLCNRNTISRAPAG